MTQSPTITLGLGLNSEITLVHASGKTVPLRPGFVEEIVLKLLRAQTLPSGATKHLPQYIPSYEYNQIASERKKTFTARGKAIAPAITLEDLGL